MRKLFVPPLLCCGAVRAVHGSVCFACLAQSLKASMDLLKGGRHLLALGSCSSVGRTCEPWGPSWKIQRGNSANTKLGCSGATVPVTPALLTIGWHRTGANHANLCTENPKNANPAATLRPQCRPYSACIPIPTADRFYSYHAVRSSRLCGIFPACNDQASFFL
jgi:hypothetical protein